MTDLSVLTNSLADRYRLDRQLGEGGMATVYLAHDLKHARDVAIKVLRSDIAESLGRERFLREIRLAARLNHPHILPLYDSGNANGTLFFVMPVMQGQTLRERLSAGTPMTVEDAVRIAIEVADALDYAHRHDIVHRDIKPDWERSRGGPYAAYALNAGAGVHAHGAGGHREPYWQLARRVDPEHTCRAAVCEHER